MAQNFTRLQNPFKMSDWDDGDTGGGGGESGRGGGGSGFGGGRDQEGSSRGGFGSGNRGFGSRRDDNGGGRGGFGGGRNYGGRRDDDSGGGRSFGGRRDDDSGGGRGGFGSRGGFGRDGDSGGRGGRNFGGRRDDDSGGGRSFGGRRDDDSGGRGFGGRRDDDSGGRSFGGRRDDDSGGRGFGGRRDDDSGGGRGGFGGRRDFGDRDGDRGGYRGGGFRGGRGGSGFGRDRDDDNGDGGGRGGFRSNRGRGSAPNTPGFDGDGGSGFRGNRGFGGGNSGGGDTDGFVVSRSFVNSSSDDRGRGRGGFSGRGGGGGRGGGRDGDREDFGGRGDRGDRGDRGERGSFGDDGPRPEPYIPPTPSDQEGDIFVNVTKGINFNKYENIPVQLTGRDPTQHITSFSQARLSETISENVSKAGYTDPTPVQKYGIPAILSGRDLMGCAQTGSGKTAAFLLPILSVMLSKGLYQGASMDPGTAHPTALIIAPTRELALQIFHEARKFSYTTIIEPVVAYGGTSVGYQLRNLEKGCHILVGTPGRLIDFMTRGKVRLDKVKFLVLDEADRMLDMGFIPDVKKVVHEFDMCQKSERQTLMFSATFPEEIQRLAADFLNDYLFLTVGKIGGAANDIVQKIVCVEALEKREKLAEILRNKPEDKVLVFVETKRQADFLATYLSQENFPTTSIHGARQQREREEALHAFKTGKTPVLVATSVAARGLDIPKVNHVVNFDMPTDISEYVHRIGRTGRIGHTGLSTSFFDTSKDTPIARSLVKILSDAEQDVPTFLEEIAESAIGTGYGAAGGNFGGTDRRQGGGGGGRNFEGGSGGFGGQSFGDPINTGFNSSVPPTAGDDESWD